jgi:hypothetical protein
VRAIEITITTFARSFGYEKARMTCSTIEMPHLARSAVPAKRIRRTERGALKGIAQQWFKAVCATIVR